MDKVSVIIPVYNVEMYIGECVDSLLEQTHKELEIILVDDGSTDSSPDICDSYAEKDSRIKVIHKKNGGAASARNEGLRVFTGDYVCLVDGDDTVRQDYVSHLLDAVRRHSADVAVCSYKRIYRNTSTDNPVEFPKDECMSASDYLKRFLTDWTCGIACNKIFRSKAIRDVRYSEGHKIDDEFFTYKVIMNCKRVALFDEPLYLYRMRQSSVMSSASSYQEQILLDMLAYSVERYENVSHSFPELKRAYLENLCDKLISLHRKSIRYKSTEKTIKNTLYRYSFSVIFGKTNIRTKIDIIKELTRLKPLEEGTVLERKQEYDYFK